MNKTKDIVEMHRRNDSISDVDLADMIDNNFEYTHPITSMPSPLMMLEVLCEVVHKANKTWWTDPATGLPKERNVGEMLMLAVSELAEAMEGPRKNLMDDKLPHRKMFEVELVDAVIRIFDLAAGLGLDLGGAFEEKMKYNHTRSDHKPENRVKPGGKAY